MRVPPRIQTEGGLVRAIYTEQIDAGVSGTVAPPNKARIITDQWDPGTSAALSVNISRLAIESPEDSEGDPVTATLSVAGGWVLSAAPTVYPLYLLYFAETEIGNYTDESKLVPKG